MVSGSGVSSTEKVEMAPKHNVFALHSPAAVEKTGSEKNDLFDGTISALPSFHHVDEKKVLWKMDIRLIPMLALLYLLSFMDRGNIGNAEVEGLSKTLGILPEQYRWCLTAFFFTYAAFELPSNLLLKKLRPSRWLPTIMVAWGLVVTLMGIVQNYHGLLIARIFLGVTEAGLYPGVSYYLTMWYCRHESQFRQALFFSAASIAGAFSGLLAFAISKMNGVAGLEGWRWIFILEGIATMLVAFTAYFLIYDSPETAGFLTEEERAFVIHRLKYQGQATVGGGDSEGQRVALVEQAEDFQWKYVWQAFTDWQIWAAILLGWGVVCPLYGISLFLPTIIRSLNYSKTEAQLMTIPIYVTAAILAVAIAFWSDKVGKRSPFVIGLLSIMMVGFIMCISSANPKVVYGGVFIATCAVYPTVPGIVVWISNNLAGSYKRSAGVALLIGASNLGGVMAANFYRKGDSPRYLLGHSLELGFIVVGITAAFILVLGYRRSNTKRALALASGSERNYTRLDLSAQGDKAITFRYMY